MFEEKLYKNLKELSINTSKPIAEYINTYVVNFNGLIGVAVESNCDVNINEKFNNVSIIKAEIKRDEANRNVILLYVNENKIDGFFIKLCCAFLKDSAMISTDPIKWYNGWKNILGNMKTEKKVYDVVAELKVLNYLQEINDLPNLDATEKGTFDICAKSGFYEVKATKSKSSEIITIHSQYQLDTKFLDRPLFIALCKVEQNDSGDSINDLCTKLKENGYLMSQIESYLNELGYYSGSADRNKKYLVHELKMYEVDEKFPKIIDKSFVDGKIPNNIIKIEYNLSLDGLQYSKVI